MSQKPSFASVITAPGFRYLWLNQFLTQLAYNTLNFSLVIWVYKLTDSTFAVSVIILCIYLPSLILGVFGGLLADIIDKKKILLTTAFLYAIGYLIFIPIRKVYPLLVMNTFFMNSLSQFFIPAESSSIPLLVDRKKLFLANSLFSLTLYISLLIGFSSAGVVLNKLGIVTIFMLGFAFQIIGFLLMLKLPNLKTKQHSPHSREFLADLKKSRARFNLTLVKDLIYLVKAETKQSVSYIKGKMNLAVAIGLLASMQGVIGILAVLVPSYLERVLRIHATDASYFLMMPLGGGMILGALFLGRFAHQIPRRFIVVPAVITAGVIFILMGLTPVLAKWLTLIDLPDYIPKLRYFFKVPSLSKLFAIAAFLLGLCSVAIIIPSQTVVQERTDNRIRGKILSVLVVMMNCSSAVPVLVAGGLADLVGVAPVFTALGVAIFMIGLIALKPHRFFAKAHLPPRAREFLGLGHWQG